MACGQFQISLHTQGAGHILAVRRPFTRAALRRDPQHFHCACTGLVPFYTSDPHAYAQLVSSPVGGLTASRRSARPGLRGTPAVPDATTRRGWDRGVDETIREPKRGAAARRTPRSAAGQGPRARTRHDRRPSRWRVSGGCVSWRCQPEHSGRAESDKAPACMRCRGLARPRRTGWPVARPCQRNAPPAGARYPCEGPVSRFLPRSRGHPQVVPVSER